MGGGCHSRVRVAAPDLLAVTPNGLRCGVEGESRAFARVAPTGRARCAAARARLFTGKWVGVNPAGTRRSGDIPAAGTGVERAGAFVRPAGWKVSKSS